MTFTADGKRQRLLLILFSNLAILKYTTQKQKNVSRYSPQIQIFSLHCTDSGRQTAKLSFLPLAVGRNVMLNLSIDAKIVHRMGNAILRNHLKQSERFLKASRNL